MKIYKKEIKCLFLVAFCFPHVLAQDKLCDELRHHRNWPELHRASSVCGLTVTSITESREYSIVPRIMGGLSAALAEFPWMAILTYSPCAKGCGGFLITGRHVLTAGHCCVAKKGCNVTGVILGEYDRETSVDCYRGRCAPEPIRVPVKKVTIHKDYDLVTISNDICLLTLETSVQPSRYVNPICLPDECTWKEPNYKSNKLKVAGWGIDAVGSAANRSRTPAVLQTVNMMAVPQSICGPLWEAEVGLNTPQVVNESRQLCAGMELGRDACQGDSGGPLMYQALNRMVTVGIVSFGPICSRNDTFQLPGVYTRIAHYMPWILDNMSH